MNQKGKRGEYIYYSLTSKVNQKGKMFNNEVVLVNTRSQIAV